MAKQFDPKTAVYTPAEVSAYAVAGVEKSEKDAARGFPVDLFGDYVPPFMPGELVIIQAQTSNYKSGFMHFIARKGAERLTEQERQEVIIHISVEELVETQAWLMLARETGDQVGDLARGVVRDWGVLRMAARKIGTIPIFRIGASLARAEDMPELTLSNMYRACRELTSGAVTGEKLTPAAIFVDYLQAFPFDTEVKREGMEAQRRLQVREDIYRCRQMAAFFDCPVILAAQSKQTLTGHNPPMMIPGVYDIEETASAAQRADRVISLWLPKTTHPVGKRLEPTEASYFTVAEDMLFIKINKQRGGMPAGKIFPCSVDYARNEVKLS